MNKETAKLLAELERRKKEEHLRYERPFQKQQEFHLCGKRNAWILGGNRVGKTRSGALKATLYALGKDAEKYLEDWPKELHEKYKKVYMRFGGGPTRGWVFSPSFEVQRDVTQKALLGDKTAGMPGIIPTGEISKLVWRTTGVLDLLILKNGSTIGFKSYDQGREKAQGTSQHWVWMDEEGPKEIYTEAMMRLMDTRGDMFGTMTPLLGLTYIYTDIYLNDNKPVDKRDPEIFCLFVSWLDNPYLSDDEKVRLEATLDPVELEARKYGRFIMPGKCSFDKTALLEMEKSCFSGEAVSISWDSFHKSKASYVADSTGEFEMWFAPNARDEYLISCDVAEGLETGDYSAVVVINRDKLRLDAVYHGHIEPDILADYIHRLAVLYNEAQVVIEANNHGLTTISFLKREYQNLYVSTMYDRFSEDQSVRLGWTTNMKTRPLLVDAIKRAVREHSFVCYWKRFVDEASNFVRDSKGRESARPGAHDDAVMALGIAMHVHNSMALDSAMAVPHVPAHRKEGGQATFLGGVHRSILEDKQNKEWGESDEW